MRRARRTERIMTVEGERVAGFGKLEDGLRQASPWYTWGPYVSERQWGRSARTTAKTAGGRTLSGAATERCPRPLTLSAISISPGGGHSPPGDPPYGGDCPSPH